MVEPRIVQRAPLGLRPTVLRAALQEVNMRASRQGLNRMLKRLGQNLSLRPPTPQNALLRRAKRNNQGRPSGRLFFFRALRPTRHIFVLLFSAKYPKDAPPRRGCRGLGPRHLGCGTAQPGQVHGFL